MADRKRNSCILARDSPGHIRRPGDTDDSPWYTSDKLLTRLPGDTENSPLYTSIATGAVIVRELCESRGGRPGLSVLASLLVSVDVKLY